MAVIRLSGPYGPKMIKRWRPGKKMPAKVSCLKVFTIFPLPFCILELQEKFAEKSDNADCIPQYVYHCNAHNPTGETAFHALMTGPAYAKDPMLPRLAKLDKEVPLTAIYGRESW